MYQKMSDYIPLKIHATIFVIDLFSRSFIVIVTKSGNIHHPVVQVSLAEHVGRKLLLYCCRSICNVPIFSYLERFLWIIEHMHTLRTIPLLKRNGTFRHFSIWHVRTRKRTLLKTLSALNTCLNLSFSFDLATSDLNWSCRQDRQSRVAISHVHRSRRIHYFYDNPVTWRIAFNASSTKAVRLSRFVSIS